jgi:2-polyprenyl-3-methyl-5-hydroxy-6-metoxy-1,4-benzoquinol methylase
MLETLKSLNLTSLQTRVVYNSRTRDVQNLTVWRDEVSGVIYLDEFYVGDEAYIEGSYRNATHEDAGEPNYERNVDASRRFDTLLQYVAGKNVLDFGCGAGDFLKLVESHAGSVCGVELQASYVKALNKSGINCFSALDSISDNSIDTCVSFHVIEHLPDPIDILRSIELKLVPGGTIVVEVPHANDFMLSVAGNDSFKQFTLWSQHLVLHTRESLRRLLVEAGFTEVVIVGVQRYPLSNHLGWLINNKPGGHKTSLSAIDSLALTEAYEDALMSTNATDTLIAIGKVV